jgi:hypothetical protein
MIRLRLVLARQVGLRFQATSPNPLLRLPEEGVYNLRGVPRVAATCCPAGRLTLGCICVAPVGGFWFGAGLPRPAKGGKEVDS